MTVDSAFGLPLMMSDADHEDIDLPIEALVVLKYLDQGGEVSYIVRATKGVSTVETLGMAHYALTALNEAVKA